MLHIIMLGPRDDSEVIMGNYMDGKSNAERSADKVVRALEKQPFPWVQTLTSGIIGGIMVGLVVWFIQARVHQKTLAQGVAKTIAVVVANDLSISASVSEAMRQRILKREFTVDPGIFEVIYSPTVELPSASEVAPLKSEVIRALDDYKRRLSECAKHRKIYLAELRSGGKQNTLQVVLVAYCVSLDSVVLTGLQLAHQLRQHYPSTQGIFAKLPTSYRPLREDTTRIQEALNKSPDGKSSSGKAE